MKHPPTCFLLSLVCLHYSTYDVSTHDVRNNRSVHKHVVVDHHGVCTKNGGNTTDDVITFHCGRPGQSCANGGHCDIKCGVCSCTSGYTWHDCSYMRGDLKECRQCQNGGKCYGTKCVCPPYFRGKNCDERRFQLECGGQSIYIRYFPLADSLFKGVAYLGHDSEVQACKMRKSTYGGDVLLSGRVGYGVCNGFSTSSQDSTTYTQTVTIQYYSASCMVHPTTFNVSCVHSKDKNVVTRASIGNEWFDCPNPIPTPTDMPKPTVNDLIKKVNDDVDNDNKTSLNDTLKKLSVEVDPHDLDNVMQNLKDKKKEKSPLDLEAIVEASHMEAEEDSCQVTTTALPTTTPGDSCQMTTTPLPTTTPGAVCEDKHEHCSYWAQEGHCQNRQYAGYMKLNCPKSCKEYVPGDASGNDLQSYRTSVILTSVITSLITMCRY